MPEPTISRNKLYIQHREPILKRTKWLNINCLNENRRRRRSTFSGITSEITTNISGISPMAAKNIMPEKLAIDTHEYGFTSIPIECAYEYAPRHARQIDVPTADETKRILRPRRSTKNVAKYVPINWISPTIIADSFGEMVEPLSRKIFAV